MGEWHWHWAFPLAHVSSIRFPISLPRAFFFIHKTKLYNPLTHHWQKASTIWSSKGYALQTRWRFPVVPLNPLCRGVCGKREGVSDQRSPPRANFLTESRLRSAGWAFGSLKSPVGNCDVRWRRMLYLAGNRGVGEDHKMRLSCYINRLCLNN